MDDEARWVAAARGGDEEAFGHLVRAYHGRVYSLAYGMVRNTEDARELAQQTWIRVWQKLATFRSDARFYTWVYRIAANLCLDHQRRRTRAREEPLDDTRDPDPAPDADVDASSAPAPDEDMQRRESRALFEQALQGLPGEQRLAIQLREVEGLSYEEIARVMNCRIGTVMSRLFYGRKALLAALRRLQ